MRFSDEIKDSEGGSHTLQDNSDGSSPTQFSGSEIGKAVSSDEDYDEKMRSYGEDAAPSPVISRTSRDRASRDRGELRSAGRGH